MTEKQKKYIKKMRLQGRGYKSIADALFLSPNTVRDYCRRHNLGGHGAVVKMNYEIDIQNHNICKRCLKPLKHIPGKKKKTFCSDYCRKQYWRENR